jgi:hypothetical protein
MDRFHRIKDSKYNIPQSELRGNVVPCHVQFPDTKLSKENPFKPLVFYSKLVVIKLHKNIKILTAYY